MMFIFFIIQAGWTSHERPDGNVYKRGQTKLYLQKMVVSCDVLYRKCFSNCCIKEWDGCYDCIFRLSQTTCAGYEIGWEFVDAVSTGRQTIQWVCVIDE